MAMKTIRYRVGRAVVHLGLRIMPAGRSRSELYQLFDIWASHVRLAVGQRKGRIR
jgi:hypothetical protein